VIDTSLITPSWLADAKSPQAAKAAEGTAVKGEAELRKIASDFESLFSQMLLSSMRKTVQKSPLFHAGRGEEVFSELLDNHYAEAVSKKGKGLGIADMIVKKYAAHVKAQEDQKGRKLDTGASPVKGAAAVTPAAEVKRHD
jgi:Rod binding domain-containing protein